MIRMLAAIVVTVSALAGSLGSLPTTAQEGDAEATISALQTQVAELGGDESTPTPGAAAEPVPTDRPEDGLEREVNVELVLDVSGSMGQVLDTGETRMEAAKRVLDEVLAAIPDRPGVNVGLRVYGHEGDNTEAGRAASCAASELVVPVAGLDRAALSAQVALLAPTGWTPIGLSLERAGGDLPDAGDGVANAVVLVTDGLETCGGDPAGAAADLRNGAKQASTHVVGFALTPEEQQLLAGITDAGGGMLLGAGNAAELSAALFSVLEELEIVVGNGYMGGNAFTLIPAGESGRVSVVAYGEAGPLGGSMPVVVRNNTAEDVYDVTVSAAGKDASGRVVAAADDQGIAPFHVAPGTLGIGHLYFGTEPPPSGLSYEFRVESATPDDLRFARTRDLEVVEASLFEDRVVGQLSNPQDGDVEGIVRITVTCFDLEGTPLSDYWDFVETNRFAPGDLLPFQATLYGVAAGGCPAFLVAASGTCPGCAPLAAAERPIGASAPAPTPAPVGDEDDAAASGAEDARFATEPIPGITGAALRNFSFRGGGLRGFVNVPYAVLAFETPEQADAALEEAAIRYFEQRQEPLDDLLPAAPPDLGDRAIAFTGTGSANGFDVALAVLVVRNGSTIHFLIGSTLGDNPLPLLAEVAAAGLTPPGESDNDPVVQGLNEGGLWDVLPRPEALGDGAVVDDEFVPMMFGPTGDAEAPSSEGTPAPATAS